MTPEVYHQHAGRVRRLIADLDIEPSALLCDPRDFALLDGLTRRRLTPALNNQTLGEGLCAALKLAAGTLRGDLP